MNESPHSLNLIYLIKLPFYKDKILLIENKTIVDQYFLTLRKYSNLPDFIHAEEIFNAEKFVFLNDSIRYLLTRACLRKIIADELNMNPKLIEYSYGKYKKPFLNIELNNRKFYFNVSHSNEYLAICTSEVNEVGIDIEFIDQKSDILLLKEQVLSEYELNCFSQLENEREQRNYFYRLWAIKEAILKGIGIGLFYSPNSMTVFLNNMQAKVVNLLPCEEENDFSIWKNQVIPFNENYSLVFSCKGQECNYKIIHWDI